MFSCWNSPNYDALVASSYRFLQIIGELIHFIGYMNGSCFILAVRFRWTPRAYLENLSLTVIQSNHRIINTLTFHWILGIIAFRIDKENFRIIMQILLQTSQLIFLVLGNFILIII